MPRNHAHADEAGAIPPGWRRNPSAWRERRWPLALAVIGLLAALYTGLSQVGVIHAMWDPFFGSIGGEQRWRRLPWAALIFGAVITALFLVGLTLTILQATVIGHWCTICLLSATVSLLVFALGISEPIASLRYLALVWLEDGREAAWQALWGAWPAQSARHGSLDGAPTTP